MEKGKKRTAVGQKRVKSSDKTRFAWWQQSDLDDDDDEVKMLK